MYILQVTIVGVWQDFGQIKPVKMVLPLLQKIIFFAFVSFAFKAARKDPTDPLIYYYRFFTLKNDEEKL